MGDRTRGWFHKFNVSRVDGSDEPGKKHHGCEYFVLDLRHDRHAPAALYAYANSCEQDGYRLLAKDIRSKAGLAVQKHSGFVGGVSEGRPPPSPERRLTMARIDRVREAVQRAVWSKKPVGIYPRDAQAIVECVDECKSLRTALAESQERERRLDLELRSIGDMPAYQVGWTDGVSAVEKAIDEMEERHRKMRHLNAESAIEHIRSAIQSVATAPPALPPAQGETPTPETDSQADGEGE
jgi:hypothetical protein